MSRVKYADGPDRALSEGPWCHPPDMVPAVTVGQTLLVLLSAGAVSSHAYGSALTVSDAASSPGDLSLKEEATASWNSAQTSLPRTVPILWKEMDELRPHVGKNFVSFSEGKGSAHAPRELSGPSAGLSFCLALTSRLFNLPIPDDIMASAGIDALGRVTAVAQIALKVRAVQAMTPRIRRVLVAPDNFDEAQCATDEHIRPIQVETVQEALSEVFGVDEMAEQFVAMGDSDRQGLIETMFQITHRGRGQFVSWQALRAAAQLVLDRWQDLQESDRYTLKFVRGVSERHEMNAGTIPLPPEGYLNRRPRAVRIGVVTQLVQQSVDTATPDANEICDLAKEYVPQSMAEGYDQQLVLLGALARLRSVTGEPEKALRDQEELAKLWTELGHDRRASHPLVEWMRLAGALGDWESFARANELKRQVEGSFRKYDRCYVDLSWARAQVLFKSKPSGEAQNVLEQLAGDDSIPSEIKWSARRVLKRVEDEGADSSERWHVERNKYLAALDKSLEHGQQADADGHVKCLGNLEPGLIGHLLKAASDERSAYVQRFYPY